ncbi:MAG: non-canonical purine NTP pyrophosphatase [Pirellulaceae bacterium]
MASRLLVLGTRNRKKVEELLPLLEPHEFVLKSLAELPNSVDVDETGDSFAANAALKATVQARHLQAWVLGEDSGLVVDALAGAPGIYSARFSGEGATDAGNNAFLLAKLAGVPLEKRTAHYVCHATLSDPEGNVRAEAEDFCCGRILCSESGKGGFGYDPLFEIPEYHKTFGELGPAVKAVLSHRSRAIRALVPKIIQLCVRGDWP